MRNIPEPKNTGLESLLDEYRNIKNASPELKQKILDYMSEHPNCVLATILLDCGEGQLPIVHRFYERTSYLDMCNIDRGIYLIGLHTREELTYVWGYLENGKMD